MARQRSQARAEYLAHERAINNRFAKLSEENATLISEKQAWTTEKQSMAAEIERLRAQLATLENPD